MASLTVTIFSASSSGISRSNSSSKAITSSTVSRESAPRSSMNLAAGVTSPSSTPSCSLMISFTRSSMDFVVMTPDPPRSSHVQPAVHVNDLARDVGRTLGRQEPHDLRHLVGGPDPLERDRGHVALPDLRREHTAHVGVDEAGGYRVHQDTPVGELPGSRLREPDEPRL